MPSEFQFCFTDKYDIILITCRHTKENDRRQDNPGMERDHRMTDFGMPTLIENKNLEDSITLCRTLGLQFIELNMNLPQYQVEQLENIVYLKGLAEQNQIYFTVHLDENLNVCDFNHAVAEAYLETVERTIAAAKRLQVPVLNMHMNHGVHFTLPDRKVQLFEEYWEHYMKSIQKFRRRCEEAIGDAGIRICIENTDGYHNYEKEAIGYLLESRVFGLTWDIGHSHGVSDIDEPFLMEHEERLCHFHIHDCFGKKDHMALGTGEIDLLQRLELAQKHDCRCVVETKTARALQESVKWLRLAGIFK